MCGLFRHHGVGGGLRGRLRAQARVLIAAEDEAFYHWGDPKIAERGGYGPHLGDGTRGLAGRAAQRLIVYFFRIAQANGDDGCYTRLGWGRHPRDLTGLARGPDGHQRLISGAQRCAPK